MPGGASVEDVVALASRLASGPADALNVGIGWHESRVPTVQSAVPHGAWAPWARAVREAVEVPVIASNRVNTAALADAAGGATAMRDFVSMARPFLADPLFVAQQPGAAGAAGERLHRLQPVHRPVDLRPAGVVRGQPAGRL